MWASLATSWPSGVISAQLEQFWVFQSTSVPFNVKPLLLSKHLILTCQQFCIWVPSFNDASMLLQLYSRNRGKKAIISPMGAQGMLQGHSSDRLLLLQQHLLSWNGIFLSINTSLEQGCFEIASNFANSQLWHHVINRDSFWSAETAASSGRFFFYPRNGLIFLLMSSNFFFIIPVRST